MSRRPANGGDIAIIGMAGRFPGARNVEEFWQDLCEGVESISFFSQEELIASGVDPSEIADPNYVRAGSILNDIDLFDARFFGMNTREAEAMDPQQRLFMECAVHAFDDAGYNTDTYPGSIGVYAGCAMSTYIVEVYRNPQFVELVGPVQVLIGNDKDYLTTHISYKLNLRGPSLSVQTTCSTSLVAISLACESLFSRQCDMALAGGVCVRVPQKSGYYYEPGGIFTPDGHCRVFDARAAGAVFGNGVGVVVLKRLSDALADGDCIDAVIKGWAINNDGSTKESYTAPSVEGQAEVVRMAQEFAGVHPETITYIEAHGTGTTVGDPIEVAALSRAFERGTSKRAFCAIGSVKSNVGHLDHAAGVASLIKTVLALKHKKIPPNLHFESPNPEIDFANSPFYVNFRLVDWNTDGAPRRAGVSAFGIGGTNVHVVLEQAPEIRPHLSSRRAHLILMSAKTESSLEVLTGDMIEVLRRDPRPELADIAYTSQVGRRGYAHRRTLLCTEDDSDSARLLETLDQRRVLSSNRAPEKRPLVFMFPGQGAQYVNMALELYQTEPTFRASVDRSIELVNQHIDTDLREILFPSEGGAQLAEERLTQTHITQLALFVVEYGLARLWMDWGIQPAAMIGHSLGEYAAACVAGVFSLKDGIDLVAARGRMMQKRPRGGMLVVPLPEGEVLSLLRPKLSLAAVNGPSLCVVSGPVRAITGLKTRLERKGVSCTRLRTSHAFHSPMMDPVLEPFRELVRAMTLKAPEIPFISNLTGTWIKPEEATDPAYWARHLRHPVRFAHGIRELLKSPNQIYLEVGPGRQLSTLVAHNLPDRKSNLLLSSLPHPLERRSGAEVLLTTVARLWHSGTEIDWAKMHSAQRRQRVHLPRYPFERERYWVDPPDHMTQVVEDLAGVKKPDVGSWFYVPSWNYSIDPDLTQSGSLGRPPRWLVFADDCGVAGRLVKELDERKQDVTIIRAASRFSTPENRVFEIDAAEKDHYDALIRELGMYNETPTRIVHFWSVSPPAEETATFVSFEQAQKHGLYSLLYLSQALIGRKSNGPVEIVVVTNGLYQVTGSEWLGPEKATLLGACKSIPQEYQDIRFRNIDIVLAEISGSHGDAAAKQLCAELIGDNKDPIVAYRDGQRWVQTFEPAAIDASGDPAAFLREEGVYLITGGLGNIGLTIAEELARLARPVLVLVGRSGFPRRNTWDGWLTSHPQHDPVSRRIRRIREIESHGAEVFYQRADVSNEEQMVKVIDRIYNRYGIINGVIHGAGTVAEDSFFSIDQATPELCKRHFMPKVHGLIVLERLLREEDLDFHLVISSLSSVLAGLGYVGYSAANLFMDAFACERTFETEVPWITVNWDNWLFRDDPGTGDGSFENSLAILPHEGVDAFQRIMSTSWLSQVVVSVSDLQARIDQWILLKSRDAKETRKRRGSHSRPSSDIPCVGPRNPGEKAIAEVYCEILGLDQVSIHDNFFSDLSGTSLLATQLVSRLRSKLGVDLPLRRFFQGPTVAEIALAMLPVNGESEVASKGETNEVVLQGGPGAEFHDGLTTGG